MKNSRLIERAFKLRFGVKLCLLVLAGMSAITMSLYLVTAKTLEGSYGEAIYTIYNLKINIFTLFFASFYSIFLLAVATGGVAAISVLFSHKMAGPIFRLEKNLGLIASGDLTVNTKFRGQDQFIALGTEMNAMVRYLNHTVRDCSDALADIKSAEERLERILKPAPATPACLKRGLKPGEEEPPETDMREALDALERGVEGLKKAASRIRLKG
ncbi:MAG: methyl-accepting chemotaxis protein [Deltaproteobacteria bacterium]|nr:methyl-accepting chemotaxis protein [Deltaproteobacteria bacterium]